MYGKGRQGRQLTFLDSVSNAILDEYIFKNKFCEIEDLTLFTDRILAK